MDHPFFDAYELLDISPNATDLEIKKAYKKKSLEYHPDKHSNSKPSNTMFRIITRCKEILLDPKLRLEHDYALGFKIQPEAEPETIYIDRVETETNWGAVVGAGVAGVLLGLALTRTRKK
ncbi:MAG: J domain-containing protein [Crocinitomicaceae bacterium]